MANKKKVMKVQCPFERIKKYNSNSEAALYRAVIMQMITDASNISEDPKACRHERHAKEWLFSGCDDFKLVCMMAGMEANVVVRLARVLIKVHHEQEGRKSRAATASKVSTNARKLNNIRNKAESLYLIPLLRLH